MVCHRTCAVISMLSLVFLVLPAWADTSIRGTKSLWHGFEMYEHEDTKIVVPNNPVPGKHWVWRARFFDLRPGFDIAMLNQGYYVVYCDVTDLYGSPKAVKRWDKFYQRLRNDYGFAEKAVVSGMSRGGLIMYNWAIANPEKVAVMFGDAPVMDFKSFPGWWDKHVLNSYGFESHEESLAYKGNPIDNLEPLAKAGVPIIHLVGDLDDIVPVGENTGPAEEKYKAMGGIFEVIHKPNAKHDHGLEDPTPLVEFVMKYSGD